MKTVGECKCVEVTGVIITVFLREKILKDLEFI